MISSEETARRWLVECMGADGLAMDRLSRFGDMLAEENLRQNLVSPESLSAYWVRHVADSAQLLVHAPGAFEHWLDLGSGAGFPGMVIAVLRPEQRVSLVESRKRRIDWLNHAIGQLDLVHARVIGLRLENVPAFSADVISARAFAPLEKLLTVAARFSTAQTRWVLPKGRSASHELADLRGWKHMFHVEQSLTDAAAGIIVGTLPGQKGARQ